MLFHPDRPHAGPAAAMRNAKGLVQVDVADIGAVVAGAGESNLRIEVCAVEINLAAVMMHDLTNSANFGFEHAVSRWISDHDGGQTRSVYFQPWREDR